jgi:hypothetical protein
MRNIKFDFEDLTIVPCVLSDIDSRAEISLEYLPLFVAPMDTVVDEENVESFIKQGYQVCMPRKEGVPEYLSDDVFHSFGLDEVINMMDNDIPFPKKVLIDVANGHMKKLYDAAKRIKTEYSDVILMVGNIANPETYKEYCAIGVDYLRVGIGGGCFTPESLVRTDEGLKAIVDVKIGDKVITHKNRYREVVHKFEYEKEEKLLKINHIKCTKNHEFYVINKEDKDVANESNIEEYAFWIMAEELDKEKHLLIKF